MEWAWVSGHEWEAAIGEGGVLTPSPFSLSPSLSAPLSPLSPHPLQDKAGLWKGRGRGQQVRERGERKGDETKEKQTRDKGEGGLKRRREGRNGGLQKRFGSVARGGEGG